MAFSYAYFAVSVATHQGLQTDETMPDSSTVPGGRKTTVGAPSVTIGGKEDLEAVPGPGVLSKTREPLSGHGQCL